MNLPASTVGIEPSAAQRKLKPGQKLTRTFCRICTGFCGLEVITENDEIVRVLPDTAHAYSWRDFCAKGGNTNELRAHPKRLTRPMKRVGDRYVEASWDEAISDIAARLNAIRAQHGPHAIASYIGNPGVSNSPNAIFQGGFMAGLGSANAFTVGSVDQNNFHLNAREMYGCEMAVLIPDVDHAKCFLFLGMNPAVSTMGWLDTVPDGWKRVLAAKDAGADLIIVDPRQTPSTKKASTHVRITPGEDWALLLAIIKRVFENRWEHAADCAEASGIDTLRELAAAASIEHLSARCGVSVEQIGDLARRFATAETAVCVARTGVSQHRNGTLGEWLSHALNLITGRIDRKGGRYYQPGVFKNTMKMLNAMTPPQPRRSRIGGHAAIAGGYPLAILPDEITTPGQDQIRALFINSGNPVISGPDGARLDAALAQLELLVAIDFFQRESHRHAHWLIPGSHFLERDEFFALFGVIFERSYAQLGVAAVPPRDGLKPEWEFFRDLAVEMGVPFMGLRGMNTMIRASRWLAKRTGNPRLAFNPRWLWAFMVKAFSPLKWKHLVSRPEGYFYREHSYGHFRPLLQTPDGRIQAAPPAFVAVLRERLAEPLPAPDPDYPLQLVNQRRVSMMNSWLVETVRHRRVYGDHVDLHPDDAAARGIADGQTVQLRSVTGAITVTARLTDEVPPGIVSMDHGWGSRLFDPRNGGAPEVQGVNRNLLVSATTIDELAGTPNLTGTRVEVRSLGG